MNGYAHASSARYISRISKNDEKVKFLIKAIKKCSIRSYFLIVFIKLFTFSSFQMKSKQHQEYKDIMACNRHRIESTVCSSMSSSSNKFLLSILIYNSLKTWKNNGFLPPWPMLIVLLHTRSRLFFIFSKRRASRLAVFRWRGMRFEKMKKKPLACVQ